MRRLVLLAPLLLLASCGPPAHPPRQNGPAPAVPAPATPLPASAPAAPAPAPPARAADLDRVNKAAFVAGARAPAPSGSNSAPPDPVLIRA